MSTEDSTSIAGCIPPEIGDDRDARLTNCGPSIVKTGSSLAGKRIGMAVISSYPHDPRPRRAIEAFLNEGAQIDLICMAHERLPSREHAPGLEIFRLPLKHRRRGKLAYAYEYSAFILMSTVLFLWRSVIKGYELIYVHNMPDVLVFVALLPKVFGAKVILDQHDPMPELMMTIFGSKEESLAVRIIRKLEKLSFACADLVITVNIACKRIFAARSCRAGKIRVVMNSPDSAIFPYRSARSYASQPVKFSKPFVIMYHGSLVKRNGLEVAVEAMARVRREIPSAELWIYGPQSNYLSDVLRSAHQQGIQNAVRYLGPKTLEELVTEIENCDVGVIPNYRNAFTEINTPTRVFEYLALGKPVVAPRTAGILDYFTSDSLFFFEAGNAQELAGQISYVFSNPDRAIEVVERGQQVYLSHTWEQEREMLVRTVREMLASPRQTAALSHSSSTSV
ncbi:MAG TPA: glycosyltransferase family 4 protein [Candidatus Sulfotelmatobacter sp.]|nr:glycosyltransferase family 4 protein [Candidatus Sulfotelmatobacter sp.]